MLDGVTSRRIPLTVKLHISLQGSRRVDLWIFRVVGGLQRCTIEISPRQPTIGREVEVRDSWVTFRNQLLDLFKVTANVLQVRFAAIFIEIIGQRHAQAS